MDKSAINSISIFVFVVVAVLMLWGVGIIPTNLTISYTTAIIALIGGVVSIQTLRTGESERPIWLTLAFVFSSIILLVLGGFLLYNLLL